MLLTNAPKSNYTIKTIKQVRLHLDSNQGRQIAGLNALPLSYRVRQDNDRFRLRRSNSVLLLLQFEAVYTVSQMEGCFSSK